jgi:hypothetical protein
LARLLLNIKQDQPGRGIDFTNLGEGLKSGTTGLFLFSKKAQILIDSRRGVNTPALMMEFGLSGEVVLPHSLPATAKKGGETITMKIATIAAVAALAIAALGLGACASKPAPAPAPSSIGTSK